MPTTTIPALPAVTDSYRADILYISQAGVSHSITLSNLLNFHTGEGRGFTINNFGYVGFSTAGAAFLTAVAGAIATVNVAGVGSNLTIQGSGQVQLRTILGQTMLIDSLGGPGSITWNAAGHITIADTTPQTPTITYATGSVMWWGMGLGAPLTINDAINRIAAQVAVLGGPIP